MARRDTTPKWHIFEKLKNFQNRSMDFNFFFIIHRLSLELPVGGITRIIPQFFLGFLILQSSPSWYRILVFRILKICLAVPSSSHYYFVIHQGYAY